MGMVYVYRAWERVSTDQPSLFSSRMRPQSCPMTLTLPDLTGTRALVTGGSDGIGLSIASRLAAAGAELILPVRNARKGEAAVATIMKTAPDARVVVRRHV